MFGKKIISYSSKDTPLTVPEKSSSVSTIYKYKKNKHFKLKYTFQFYTDELCIIDIKKSIFQSFSFYHILFPKSII